MYVAAEFDLPHSKTFFFCLKHTWCSKITEELAKILEFTNNVKQLLMTEIKLFPTPLLCDLVTHKRSTQALPIKDLISNIRQLGVFAN